MMQQQQQQKGSDSTNSGLGAAAISSPPFASPNPHSFSSLQYFPDDGSFLNLYSSIFPPKDPSLCSASVSLTPSTLSCDEEDEASTDRRLYLARLTLQYQQMEDNYELCLSHLHDAAQEVEALRQENSRLRKANSDLAKRLNPLSVKHQSSSSFQFSSSAAGYSPNSLSIMNDFRRLCLSADDSTVESSPTSVLGYGKETPLRQPHRISLPKSISIRSSGYLKSPGAGAGAAAGSHRNGRIRVSSPVLMGSVSSQPPPPVTFSTFPPREKSQKVYVPGNTKVAEQEAALEFEVYGQGMFKTELCNKWEETGTCPYGDHCQFAHGVGELRPVIRHPRYKTEVCRMVLAGETCPYGHRCHFRHALTSPDRC